MTRARIQRFVLILLSFAVLAPGRREARAAETEGTSSGRSATAADTASAPPIEMRIYYVGFLYRGPKWSPAVTPEVEKLQAAHLANIGRLAATGKLILAGPFDDGGNLRGMFVFQVDSMEEAKALCDTDPAVQAGRLIVELHPWYSAKGIGILKEEKPGAGSKPGSGGH